MKYRDEKDKCYGIVGMTIGLNVWDAEDMYSGVDLDAEGFDCISFSNEYYYSGTPSISPKVTWQHQLKVFKVTMGITISNLICRNIVGDHVDVNKKDREELLHIFKEQGDKDLALTSTECGAIFDKSYNYLLRLYNHDQVQEMVDSFADTLSSRRKMSASEVSDALSLLNQ